MNKQTNDWKELEQFFEHQPLKIRRAVYKWLNAKLKEQEEKHKEEMIDAIYETSKEFGGTGKRWVGFTSYGKEKLRRILDRFNLTSSGEKENETN